MTNLPILPHPRYAFLQSKQAFLISSLLFSPFTWIFEPPGVIFVAFLLTFTEITATGIGVISSFYFITSAFLPFFQTPLKRLRIHKTGTVALGCAGVIIVSSAVLAPFLPSPIFRLWGFIALIFTGNLILLSSRQIVSSWKNSLFSDPPGVQSLYKLDMRTSVTAFCSLMLAGLFIDFTGNGSYWSFCAVFAAVFYSGWLSFQFLTDISGSDIESFSESLPVQIHRDQSCITPPVVKALRITVAFSLGLLIPFFSVFLVDSRFLGMGLARAAFLVVIQILFFTIGNAVWERMKERYGSFPILRLGLFLEAGVVIVLIFIVSWNGFLLPLLTAVSGLALSGIKVSLLDLTSACENEPEERLLFSPGGNYSGFSSAAGAFFGAIIFHASENPFPSGLSPWSALHLIFFISALFFFGAAVILSFVSKRTDKTLKSMAYDLFLGNPFLFVFYSLALLVAKTEDSRAQAIIGLGKSRSPLALEMLTEALDDPVPRVRKNAALSLGKIKSVSALPLLVAELEDRESDLRCEAAEALGKIGNKYALPYLFRALDDNDARVRNVSVTALAEIGGDSVRETLISKFSGPYDSDMFPTLADGLSRLGVTEIVEPVMSRIGNYQSIVLRLQLLNSVCRLLGAGNAFYRILSKHEYERVNEVNKIIRHAQGNVQRSPLLKREPVAHINRILESIALSYREEDHKTFLTSVWEFMAYIQLVMPDIASHDDEAVFLQESGRRSLRPYLEAVNRFLLLKKNEDIKDEGMVFLVICLDCLLNEL
ncbi:MAG: MFS transporter [Candidatus Latescibacterota bacterium]